MSTPGTDGFHDLGAGLVAIGDVKAAVALEPILQRPAQRLGGLHAGEPAGQAVPEELARAQRAVIVRMARCRQLAFGHQQHVVGHRALGLHRAQTGPKQLFERRGRGASRADRCTIAREPGVNLARSALFLADDAQQVAQLADLRWIDGHQGADGGGSLGLEQIDPGVAALDDVHHLLDHLGAGVRVPVTHVEGLARVQAAAQAREVLIAVVVPGVHLVAVDAVDTRRPDHAGVASACGRELDARAGCQVIARQPGQDQALYRRKRDLDVMIADDEDQGPPRRAGKGCQRLPDGLESVVVHDAGDHVLRLFHSDITTADIFGQRVEHVASQHEGQRVVGPMGRETADVVGQARRLAQDLEARQAPHVDVGDHMDGRMARQVSGIHGAVPRATWGWAELARPPEIIACRWRLSIRSARWLPAWHPLDAMAPRSGGRWPRDPADPATLTRGDKPRPGSPWRRDARTRAWTTGLAPTQCNG